MISDYKGVFFYEDDSQIDLFFKRDLENFKYVKFSLNPNLPQIDEEVKHEIRGSKILPAREGFIILLDLVNTETGEQYSHAFCDVVRVEPNRSFTSESTKYYITCLNRAEAYNLRELREWKENGLTLDKEQNERLANSHHSEHFTFRIRFNKN
ncbi:hypothetical protein [Terribacillus saccharophilus]|uniref:hypothetical protein n=1 Tax=Terribacillus saccharophilus TaxID=361277 RepID=UPI002989E2B8|nr:hypothetical protein [Terribacillus saccharophilus]MCM3225962.1 hypothetical protein [Terribacillus saccharophilus]